jgi:hypothetical protein
MQPPVIFLRLNQEVRGPFGPAILKQLAETGVITPDSEASLDSTGPWVPMVELGDYATIFPLKRYFRFKEPSFDNVNQAPGPTVDHREIIAAANRPAPSRKVPQPARSAAAAPPNDVDSILRENRRIQAGWEKPLDRTPRSNRRRSDYLITMAAINGIFIWRLVANWGDPTTMVFGISGIVVTTCGLTWLMFGVMDRY